MCVWESVFWGNLIPVIQATYKESLLPECRMDVCVRVGMRACVCVCWHSVKLCMSERQNVSFQLYLIIWRLFDRAKQLFSCALINRISSYSVYVFFFSFYLAGRGCFSESHSQFWSNVDQTRKFFCLKSSTQHQQIKRLITVLLHITQMADKCHLNWGYLLTVKRFNLRFYQDQI